MKCKTFLINWENWRSSGIAGDVRMKDKTLRTKRWRNSPQREGELQLLNNLKNKREGTR